MTPSFLPRGPREAVYSKIRSLRGPAFPSASLAPGNSSFLPLVVSEDSACVREGMLSLLGVLGVLGAKNWEAAASAGSATDGSGGRT